MAKSVILFKKKISNRIMNKAVDLPSKVIKIAIGNKEEEKKEDTIPTGVTVDFYNLDSDAFQVNKAKVLETSPLKEILELKKTSLHDEGIIKTTSTLCKPFILESIRYDTRVKTYQDLEEEITVHFGTLEDAISFYQQYIKLVKMTFVQQYDMDFLSGAFDLSYENTIKIKLPPCEQEESSSESIDKEFLHLKPFSEYYDSYEAGILSKEEFFSKVEYFNRMKGLYSKNEIKKIQSEIELKDVSHSDSFVFLNAKELAVGAASNVFFQSIVKDMNDEQVCELIKCLGYDIAAISATKYGAYSIQSLILACTTSRSHALINKYFGEYGKYLFCHEIGNYSIQRILLFDEEYVLEIIKNELKNIIEDVLGFKVLKRCLELIRNSKEKLEKEIEKIQTESNEEKCKILKALLK